MALIEPVSEHRLAVEDLPAQDIIDAIVVNNVYMLYKTATTSKLYCYIKVTNKTPITLPGEQIPYDCDITGPAVYIETTNAGEVKTGEIGIRTIPNLISNKTHIASDNWMIYTSSTTEYNSMVDLVINSVCIRGYDELIFYCDCNRNMIDQVSGLDIYSLWSSSTYVVGGTSYVLDPLDSTRYCAKKVNGRKYVSPLIGNYNISGTTADRFIISKQSNISDETNYKWLASPTYGNHRVEFDWYLYNNNTTRCVFDSTGLANNNSNATNSGIALNVVNGNVLIQARNNSSTYMNTTVGSVSTLHSKWYKVTFSFHYDSATSYTATVKVYDKATNNLISEITRTMTLPLNTNRGGWLFLGDSWGYGAYAQNVYDMIKEVKVYQLDYPN